MITRRMLLPLLLFIVISFTSGCDYERIDILVGDDIYNGHIMTDYHTVEVTRNSIVLKPGSRLSVKTPLTTQFICQFEAAIISGEGMNVYLRTVEHAFDTSNGIRFHYSTSGTSLRMEDGREIPLHYNAELDPQTLRFTHEAALLEVKAGCNQIFEGETNLPATEYMIFETLPGSTVEIKTINYYESNLE